MKIFLFVVWVCAMIALGAVSPPDGFFWNVLWGFTVPFLAFSALVWFRFYRKTSGHNADSDHPPGAQSDS